MNKIEALEWAADYAARNKLFDMVPNQRGYTDGQTPITPAERAKIISELADQVVDTPAQSAVNLFNPVAMMLEAQVVELRKIRARASSVAPSLGDDIQEVSNWLEKLAKELRGGPDGD